MHLRRALLLFAVVLGLAALAASLSRPARRSPQRAPTTPSELPTLAPSPPAKGPARARFSEGRRPRVKTLEVGVSAIVTVEVKRAGQVELEGFGLTATAEPATPARFDVLADEPGRYDLRFTPAGRGESETIGALRIVRSPT